MYEVRFGQKSGCGSTRFHMVSSMAREMTTSFRQRILHVNHYIISSYLRQAVQIAPSQGYFRSGSKPQADEVPCVLSKDFVSDALLLTL